MNNRGGEGMWRFGISLKKLVEEKNMKENEVGGLSKINKCCMRE